MQTRISRRISMKSVLMKLSKSTCLFATVYFRNMRPHQFFFSYLHSLSSISNMSDCVCVLFTYFLAMFISFFLTLLLTTHFYIVDSFLEGICVKVNLEKKWKLWIKTNIFWRESCQSLFSFKQNSRNSMLQHLVMGFSQWLMKCPPPNPEIIQISDPSVVPTQKRLTT
jgi:hypothetical protein